MLRHERGLLRLVGSLLLILLVVACSNLSADDKSKRHQRDPGAGMSQIRAFDRGHFDQVVLPEERPTELELAQSAATGDLVLTWTIEKVGEGIEPALALGDDGAAHIAWLTEQEMGGVYYANNRSGTFEAQRVASGYFDGPVDLALGPENTAYIAYHDYQAPVFDQELGDAVVAIGGESWQLVTISDPGHDGWDNSIAVGVDGFWHQASIDPLELGGTTGVEYATNAGAGVSVTQVGGPPVDYEFGTSIALDEAGVPGVAYYDDTGRSLLYAHLGDDGWTVEEVDGNGDAGRYAALAYDAAGNPHVAYFVLQTQNRGLVRHAWRDRATWQFEEVGALDKVQPGHIGVHKITALAFDREDNLHIAYTDADSLVYGRREGGNWLVQDIPHSGDPLGQLVELAVDPGGNPHLVWYEIAAFSPALNGNIIYAMGS